ncbi:unnamed protein product [Brachionus calyciflorus]|uniref:Uncharacterized protein n=1 Tax=Brachionus calyciflorus TaxID=104777 RepID=A0A814IAA9_9BILA|nr:unnamed protein product [Brachionus calyciflorus]
MMTTLIKKNLLRFWKDLEMMLMMINNRGLEISFEKRKPNNLDEFVDALRLFPDDSTCYKYNHAKLKDLNMPICRFTAENNPSIARNFSEENFYGLNNVINLAINSKVTLTKNLWTSKGLIIGANGIIRDIINPNANDYRHKLPSTLLIEFDFYVGPSVVVLIHDFNYSS